MISRSLARVPPLTSIGLSARADLAYRQLATSSGQRLTDLGRSLGIPVRQARQVLDELADIGAAAPVAQPGRPARAARLWSAAPADRVAADVRRRQRAATVARHRLYQQLASLADLAPHPSAKASRLFGSTTSAQARLLDLVRAERREHLVMSPDLAFTPAAVQAAAPAHRLLVERRIAVMELGVPPAPEDATDNLVGELSANGARFRELPSVPLRLILFDRHTALVRLDPIDARRGVLEISDRVTVAALVDVFFRHWERARDSSRPEPVVLTPRERAVVNLLACGCSDAEAATELGLSLRTIAYTVHNLMIRFGATNRFQLGLAVGPLIGAGALSTDRTSSSGPTERH